jgi:hypothetical protein
LNGEVIEFAKLSEPSECNETTKEAVEGESNVMAGNFWAWSEINRRL